MNSLLQTLVSTLVQGSMLALISIGMTLVYGTLRVLTFADGQKLEGVAARVGAGPGPGAGAAPGAGPGGPPPAAPPSPAKEP